MNKTNKDARGKVVFKCEYCGKENKRARSLVSRNDKNFCDAKCYSKFLSNKRIGKGNPNYKNAGLDLETRLKGLTDNKKWKKAVKERDNYRCQKCGSRESLEAHHIIKMKDIIESENIETIEDAKNCALLWSIDNGKTYCTKCHKEVHRNENK